MKRRVKSPEGQAKGFQWALQTETGDFQESMRKCRTDFFNRGPSSSVLWFQCCGRLRQTACTISKLCFLRRPREQGDPLQNVPAAELFAIIMILEVALPPVRVFFDCAYVVEGIQKGEAWSTRVHRNHAHLWDRLFCLLAGFCE